MNSRLLSWVIVLMIITPVLLAVGCGSGEPKKQVTLDSRQSEKKSLFDIPDTPTEGSQYNYQAIYPGDSIDTDSLIIGLDSAMSGDFARSGVSIWRGMVLAVDEINADGGLLGKKLQIVVKDHHANPIRGVENLRQFADMDRLLAVMGGMHTPVMLEELPAIHDNQIISLVPWAAGTPIVDNGYDPNYVFRLSVRDEYAGPFLVRKLVNAGYEKPALFLEKTGWGRSNRRALTEALENRGLSPATVQWFNWSEKSFREEIDEAHDNGADIIVFVGNAPEGATLVHSMSEQESSDRLPILSHWGITGGEFFSEMQDSLNDVQLRVLQTRSFLDPANPQYARDEIQVYCAKFTCPDSGSRNIIAPVGTAHAHDLIHLLAQAVDKANSPSRPKIRKALEQLGDWPGIVRTYSRPFTPSDHEALTLDDLRLARYDSSGHLVLSDLE